MGTRPDIMVMRVIVLINGDSEEAILDLSQLDSVVMLAVIGEADCLYIFGMFGSITFRVYLYLDWHVASLVIQALNARFLGYWSFAYYKYRC